MGAKVGALGSDNFRRERTTADRWARRQASRAVFWKLKDSAARSLSWITCYPDYFVAERGRMAQRWPQFVLSESDLALGQLVYAGEIEIDLGSRRMRHLRFFWCILRIHRFARHRLSRSLKCRAATTGAGSLLLRRSTSVFPKAITGIR